MVAQERLIALISPNESDLYSLLLPIANGDPTTSQGGEFDCGLELKAEWDGVRATAEGWCRVACAAYRYLIESEPTSM